MAEDTKVKKETSSDKGEMVPTTVVNVPRTNNNKLFFTPQIEKLKNERDFIAWRPMMEDVLEGRGVLYLIKHTPEEIDTAIAAYNNMRDRSGERKNKYGLPYVAKWSPPDVDITDERELEAQKVLARTLIASNIDIKLHSLFRFCGSREPYEIWKCLVRKLQPDDYNAKVQAHSELWGCKQQSNEMKTLPILRIELTDSACVLQMWKNRIHHRMW